MFPLIFETLYVGLLPIRIWDLLIIQKPEKGHYPGRNLPCQQNLLERSHVYCFRPTFSPTNVSTGFIFSNVTTKNLWVDFLSEAYCLCF